MLFLKHTNQGLQHLFIWTIATYNNNNNNIIIIIIIIIINNNNRNTFNLKAPFMALKDTVHKNIKTDIQSETDMQ